MPEQMSKKLQHKLIALSLHPVYDVDHRDVWKVVALALGCLLFGFILGRVTL